jgi:hypothetical protein
VKRAAPPLVVAALSLTACGGASGYNDPERLAGSIGEEVEKRSAFEIDKGVCMKLREHVFQCTFVTTSGVRDQGVWRVSDDGESYTEQGV